MTSHFERFSRDNRRTSPSPRKLELEFETDSYALHFGRRYRSRRCVRQGKPPSFSPLSRRCRYEGRKVAPPIKISSSLRLQARVVTHRENFGAASLEIIVILVLVSRLLPREEERTRADFSVLPPMKPARESASERAHPQPPHFLPAFEIQAQG